MNSFVKFQNHPPSPVDEIPHPSNKLKRPVIGIIIVLALCNIITIEYFLGKGSIAKYLSSKIIIPVSLNQPSQTTQSISPTFNSSKTTFQEITSTSNTEIESTPYPSPSPKIIHPTPSPFPTVTPNPTPSPFLSIKDSISYYDIYGDEEDELQDEITAKGPTDNGSHFAAYTNWVLRPIYSKRQEKHGCIGQGVSVELTIVITLPRWNPPVNAPIVLVTDWNDYIEKLLLHENGHKQRAIDSAYDAFAKLNALPIYGQCWEYDEAIKNTNEDIKQKLRDKDTAYDNETRHGQIQGADFY